MQRCFSVLLVLPVLVGGSAAAEPSVAGVQLDPPVPPAGQVELLTADLEPYGAARRLLARGKPAEALDQLGDGPPLFSDRAALLRADALLALGEVKLAAAAYRTALAVAVVPAVARAAARGLVEALPKLGRADEAQAVLDAMLAEKPGAAERRRLELAQARLLASRGKKREAVAAATALIDRAPGSPEAPFARDLVRALIKAGAKPPKRDVASERRRIAALLDARMWDDAKDALAAIGSTDAATQLLSARLLEGRGEPGADAAYAALGKKKVPAAVAAEALDRLARRRLRVGDHDGALSAFDALTGLAGTNRRARKAEFLAAWIPYADGNFAESRARFLRYADRHRRTRDRDEALWFAGWASYLGAEPNEATAALERLLAEHPSSALVPQAHYWLGRIAHQAESPEAATKRYEAALGWPLSYYGLWAAHRLGELGVELPVPVPPEGLAPAPRDAALAALGPSRPVTVDRAVALFSADRPGEALEELDASAAALLAAPRGKEQRLAVADLLASVGAHHLAFRIGGALARTGAELQSKDPLAWRAWQHAYPRAFAAEMEKARAHHPVESELVYAVMRTESHFQPWAKSPVGARGLMQLMPRTAKSIGLTTPSGRLHAGRIQDPASNIWLGTWYLGQLLDRYDGQIVAAAGAYNGGPTAMERWLSAHDGAPLDEFVERITYRETRRYVRRVVETWAIYRQLYEGERPALPTQIRWAVDPKSKASF